MGPQVRLQRFVWTHALSMVMTAIFMLRCPFSMSPYLASMPPGGAYAAVLTIDLVVPLLGTWLLEQRSRRLFLRSLTSS